jgi:hypothetical protein
MATFNLSYDGIDGSQLKLSAWERFLRGAGVPEGSCASLVAGRTQRGKAIRTWVLANYAKRYVPEDILDLLGLRKQLVLRWQRDERDGVTSAATGEAGYQRAS